ncbi:periplasmic heavy metal sensor [Sulfitobacter sp.]|uniref:periplasmic heavy metal sensor n=1 Tax=Sulfitobacter sp. TaxID=1903071 RepID=UPI003001DBC2
MAEVKQKRRWMPVVLGLSLAVNFAVAAAVVGASWRHRSGDHREERVARGGAIYMQALPREARHALRQQLRAAEPKRMETGDMIAVLRQDPFDASAATRVLVAERYAGLARQGTATAMWLDYVTSMTVSERNAYADRLQHLLDRRPPQKRP